MEDRILEVRRRVRGSAIGALVGGVLWGAVGMLALVAGAWGGENWWVASPWFVYLLFCAVRPWFLGVWVGDESFEIRSWFRRYVFDRGQVAEIDMVPYRGIASAPELTWVVFVGPIRTIRIRTVDGRRRSFPSTVAGRNRTLRLARQLRTVVGLPSESRVRSRW